MGRLIIFLLYLVIGAYSFQYVIWLLFGKDVPWYVDLIGGVITGWLSVWLAIIGWILTLVGIHFPLFPQA